MSPIETKLPDNLCTNENVGVVCGLAKKTLSIRIVRFTYSRISACSEDSTCVCSEAEFGGTCSIEKAKVHE